MLTNSDVSTYADGKGLDIAWVILVAAGIAAGAGTAAAHFRHTIAQEGAEYGGGAAA
jgi:hypothetical protein